MARVVIDKRLIEVPDTPGSIIQALGLQVIHDGAPTSSDLWSIRWVDDSISDRGAIDRLLPIPITIGNSAGNHRLQ